MEEALRRWTICLLLALAAMPGVAAAQYLFMDTDGDGSCHYPFEQTHLNSPTVVDVWIDTSTNRDGGPTTCPTGQELSISGYELVFDASGYYGNVLLNGWTNHMGQFTEDRGTKQQDGLIRVAFASPGTLTYLPPGRYRLGTLDVTLFTRCSTIFVVGAAVISGTTYETNFTTQCAGADEDYTMRLWVDFFDTCDAGPVCSDVEGTSWGKIKQRYP